MIDCSQMVMEFKKKKTMEGKMRELSQSEFEHLIGQVENGEFTPMEANVEIVLRQRVMLVTQSIPRDVRKVLNAAVKEGRLGHIKKSGYKPEAYFHPKFDYLVAGDRNEYESEKIRLLNSIRRQVFT